MLTRRNMLQGAGAAGAAVVLARSAHAQVDRARAEGTVSWYTADTPITADVLAAAFKKQFGINLEVYRKTTLPLIEQFVRESQRGGSPADVVSPIGLGPVATTLVPGKYLARYQPPGTAALPPELHVEDAAYTYMLCPMGVVYNTRMVSPAEAALLRTYKGWLDPRFAGRMAMTAPTGGTTAGNMLMLQQRLGPAFIEALATTQKVVVYQTVAATEDAVVAGEQAIALNVTPSSLAKAVLGAPIRYVGQDEWTFVAPVVASISAKAPHPAAARLFVDWLFTPEVQRMHAASSFWAPVVPGVQPRYDAVPDLTQPTNPVSAQDPAAFDREITSNVAGWRGLLGW